MFPPLNEQMDLIRRGAFEIIPEEDLARKLERSISANAPLTVKLGCDPSRPDLHLGHSVVLRKLRQFQDLGHQAVLIIGDFTGMIGDPSGRNKTRPALTLEETRANGQTYFEQATRILTAHRVTMVYNSEWLAKMSFADVIHLASKYTVARMLERDDFTLRYRAGEPISVHEFLYPLAQAMDSVAIKADVELGGTDQKFNLLVGRDIQREFAIEPQVILTMPILPGTDGVEKMSKSLDNYIGISDTPREMYGRTLRIPDPLILQYFELVTDLPSAQITEVREQLAHSGVNPRDVKRRLARTIVRMYHTETAAVQAEEEFDRIFIQKAVPDEVEEFRLDSGDADNILSLLVATKLAASRTEARRLVDQGGVSIEGERVTNANGPLPSSREFVLKVGKRRFLRVFR